jgi:hypothetical protein
MCILQSVVHEVFLTLRSMMAFARTGGVVATGTGFINRHPPEVSPAGSPAMARTGEPVLSPDFAQIIFY